MQSKVEKKTLTLRITSKKTIEAIEFISDLGDHNTDTKAIFSALDTFEEDHYRLLKMQDRLRFLEFKVSEYESYFEEVEKLESLKNKMLVMPNLLTSTDFLD